MGDSLTPSRPHALTLLALIALVHGLIYVFLVPPWQMPDEPMLFEYAALTAELGRPPTRWERSPALEGRIVASMVAADFFRHAAGQAPAQPPRTLEEALALFPMPRQVGGDPPLYFAAVALPLRLTVGWPIEAQLTLLRLLSATLLPLIVICTYLACQALAPRSPWPTAPSLPISQSPTPQSPTPQSLLPTAAAALVALHPMAASIGAAVSNDGLANLLGALLCLLLVRMVGRGLPGRELLAFTALALLALAVKRTALPFVLLAALLCALWLARLALRRGPGAVLRRTAVAGLTVGCLLLGGWWLAGQLAWDRAARWYDTQTLTPFPRAPVAGGYGLAVDPGTEALQVVPDVAMLHLRNNALRAGARVWSDGPATGRLVVYAGDRRQEHPFSVSGEAAPELGAAVPSYARDVRLGIVADSGRIYVSGVWMRGVGVPGELIGNGEMRRPALRPESVLGPLVRYLRVEELLWLLSSERLRWDFPLAEWAGWLFVSFWGHFGWFNIPLVAGSAWAWALGAICAIGLAGALLALVRARGPLRAQIGALLALVAVALLPPLLNGLIDQFPVQQGRYLFPVLPAAAALIALGHLSLAPRRARQLWMAGWLSFWLALAAAAILRLAQYYR